MNLLLLVLITLTHVNISNTAQILLLRGACSSGKSSLIAALQKIDPQWHAIEEDSFFVDATLQAITQNFPTEISIISQAIAPQNIFNAVKRSEFQFLPTASSEEQNAAINAVQQIQCMLNGETGNKFKKELFSVIENAMDTDLQQAVCSNQNILLDSWAYDSKNLQEKFPDSSVYTVIVYCPLQIALTRVQQRNTDALRSGNLLPKRFFGQLFSSYVAVYEWHPAPSNENHDVAVDQFPAEEVPALFNEIQRIASPEVLTSVSVKLNFTWSEMDATKFTKLQRDLLSHIQETHTLVSVQPKMAYDLMVNTGRNTSEECAYEILHMLSEYHKTMAL